jgi:ERCC4-type nuclease
VQKLLIGDYIINNIFIERKSWHDFLQSYRTGRLFKQMLQLYQQTNMREHRRSILILEGFALEPIERKEAFYTILTRILEDYNIRIISTLNQIHTAAFLTSLYWNTKQKKENIPSRLAQPQRSAQQCKRHILFCFPMIGQKKAEKILALCSLRKLFTLPEKQLQDYGIGKKGQQVFQEILDA